MKNSILKKISMVTMVVLLFLLCSCGSSGGVAGSRRGISGTWCPYITQKQKDAYIQRAAEVMLEEYGVEVSAEDAASPIVFGVRKGALPSNQQHAMEMQEEWQYKVYVHTKEGDRFIVELAYESMELDAIYENSLNAKASTGSFTELKDGEYYGLTEEMSQIARNRAPEIKKLLLSKDMEQLQNAMREDIWQEVSEDIASGGAAGIGIFVKVENLDVDKVGLQ